MPSDTSIYQSALQAPESFNQQLSGLYGLDALRQKAQMNQLSLKEAQNSADERDALRNVFANSNGLSDDQLRQKVLSAAPLTGSPILKNMQDAKKSMADVTKTQVETQGLQQGQSQKATSALIQALSTAQSPDDLVAHASAGIQAGLWTPQEALPILQQLNSGDPAQFNQRKNQLLQQILTPEQQFNAGQQKIDYKDSAQGLVPVNTNPNAGPIGQVQGGQVLGSPLKTIGNENGIFLTNPNTGTAMNYQQGNPFAGAQGGAPGGAPMPSPQGMGAPQAGNPGFSVASSMPTTGSNGFPVVTPQMQQSRDSDRLKILMDERQNQNLSPADQRALDMEIANTQKSLGVPAGQPQPQSPAGAMGQANPAPTSVAVPQDLINNKNVGQKDFMAPEMAKMASKSLDDVNQQVNSGRTLMQQIGMFNDAMQHYQTGPGADTRFTLAKAAAAVGLPDKVVNAINRGDISDSQEIQKLTAQMAMQSLKSAMDGQGRLSQQEFKIFAANNPNIELDPRAIQKIFQFQQQQYQQSYGKQQAFAQFAHQGVDPSQWDALYSKTLNDQGIGNPGANSTTTATAKGMPSQGGSKAISWGDLK